MRTKFGEISLALMIATSCGNSFAQAKEKEEKQVQLIDSYGDAFLHYVPLQLPAKKEPPKKIPAAPVPPKEENQPVNVDWLKKNYPMLEQRAIDNPSKENVEAYLYVRRVIMDKAQRFSESVVKVTNEDPLLNENNRVPYASSGSQMIRNVDYQAQQKAIKELSSVGGLLVFVDGSCRFCEKQLPILSSIKNNFGLEYLVISTDGNSPASYKGSVVKDNGLFRKLSLKLTPSIVYVAKPKSYTGQQDPNSYLIVSQGYYAQDELVKQISFAGFNSKLLSPAIMKDLDVWNRGVATTEDLNQLQLNPNKPGLIKKTLQPMLIKQYQ